MRLLHMTEKGLGLDDLADAFETSYAILSHRWFDEGEVLFDDMISHGVSSLSAEQHADDPKARSWAKIHGALRQADIDGFKYIWIDTCCIDKRSSAELSESINSMYNWYHIAQECYVYLWDVDGEGSPRVNGSPGVGQSKPAFSAARVAPLLMPVGTLQELIAPRSIRFFDVHWKHLGKSGDLLETLAEKTGIHHEALSGESLITSFTVAQRMSWAAFRETTRVEDEAYCLLGIFDVNMPLIYGEGTKAFMRLQEEIIRTTTDLSILAWNAYDHPDAPSRGSSLLSVSPFGFVDCGDFWPTRGYHGEFSLQLNNIGLEVSLPLVTADGSDDVYHAILNCELGDRFSRVIALTIMKLHHSQHNHDPPYMVVRKEHPCHPFEEGRDRLSIVDSNTWSRAKRSTVTILRRPLYPEYREMFHDRNNFILQLVRVDGAPSQVTVLDLYPRYSGARKVGSPKPWREALILKQLSPLQIQRGRGKLHAVELDLDGERVCARITINQHGRYLRRSLPDFKGSVEVELVGNRSLKECCERYTSSCTTKASCKVGELMIIVELTGEMQSRSPVMTLQLSIGAPDQQSHKSIRDSE